MRPGAGDGTGTGTLWRGSLVVAALSVAAATVYLCLAVAAALEDSEPGPIGTVVFSDASAGAGPTAAPATATPVPEVAEEAPVVLQGGLAPAVLDPDLTEILEGAIGEDRDHIAVAVKRVSDGRYAGFNADFQFYAASTFKLAVLYEAERRRFAGEIEYEDTLFISDEDAAEDLGTSGLLEFEEDGSITIEHLLEAAITVSDNSSAVALMHEFGSPTIDRTLRELGITTMTVSQVELWTTANDLARLMEAIYVGEGVSAAERSHMRELLLAQTIRNGIPAAIGAARDGSLLVGNKTGTWEGAQHDVAFVEAQSGAYVIAVLTDGSLEGWGALQRVAARIHNAMTKTP